MIAASYEPRQQKDFTEFLDELDASHTAEQRYAALFHVAHVITKATEAGGTGKHAAILEACREEPVVRYMVSLYEDFGGDEQIPPFILSTLVNVSCIDPQLIIDGGGFELLLKHIVLKPPKEKGEEPTEIALRNQYYALAGVFNLSEDPSCARQILERGVDAVLEKLAKAPDEETSKHATYTLRNLRMHEPADVAKRREEAEHKDKTPAQYMEAEVRKLASMLPSLPGM